MAKYASPSAAEDVKMVSGLMQLPVTAIIIAISVEDAAAVKAGMYLPTRRKAKGLVNLVPFCLQVSALNPNSCVDRSIVGQANQMTGL